jgi:DNA (cytosine-5)-methyltransferase 1
MGSMNRTEITAIDLFCGAGGMSVGLQSAGFRILGAADFWETACRTYSQNFKHPVLSIDLREFSSLDLLRRFGVDDDVRPDLVVGGPPCQGFSIQRIGKDHDSRNNLVLEFARLVLDLRPKMFLMENVLGLHGKRGRGFASELEAILIRGGYRVRFAVVNAAEYGVPQFRRRVFYYGWLDGAAQPFQFPRPTNAERDFRTVWDAIGDLPSPPENFHAEVADPLHRRMKLSPLNLERLRHIPPGGGFENLPVELRVDCHKGGAAKIGHRNVYGRLSPDVPASTITARFDSFTRGKFAHPFEDRNITLREGARLQTFDDEFTFEGSQEDIAAQIGNAVPPKLSSLIGKALIESLRMPVQATPAIIAPSDQIPLFQARGDSAECRNLQKRAGPVPSTPHSA